VVRLAVDALEGQARRGGRPGGRSVPEAVVDQRVAASIGDLSDVRPIGPHRVQGDQGCRVTCWSELALEGDPPAVRRPLGESVGPARRLARVIDEGPI
jgi:hypothetical protein